MEIEVLYKCPRCLAMESLTIEDGVLLPTTHWIQKEARIYHRSCERPCIPYGVVGNKNLLLKSDVDILLDKIFHKHKDLTATKLGEILGVSRTTITRWREHRCRPNASQRIKLLKFIE